MNCQIPPLPELTCRDIQPTFETDGETIWINGKYRGHITMIGPTFVQIEYRCDNQYMKDQKSMIQMDRSAIEQIKML